MEYTKLEAQMMLGVWNTSFYKYVKTLNIELINRITDRGKMSYIREEDLEKILKLLGRSKESFSNPANAKTNAAQSKESGAEELEQLEQIRQENFTLKLKTKEQEELLHSKEQLIGVYKDQQQQMQLQRSNAQQEFKGLYNQYIRTSNKATAYLIIAIALLVVLLLFISLVLLKKLQF